MAREASVKRASNSPRLRRLKPAILADAHFGDHRGHFARRELRDGLHVAAVFVAERDVAEQVFDGGETLGFEHGRAGRSDSFDVGEGGGEVHALALTQCTMRT